jgi:bifunctional DNase/RNase
MNQPHSDCKYCGREAVVQISDVGTNSIISEIVCCRDHDICGAIVFNNSSISPEAVVSSSIDSRFTFRLKRLIAYNTGRYFALMNCNETGFELPLELALAEVTNLYWSLKHTDQVIQTPFRLYLDTLDVVNARLEKMVVTRIRNEGKIITTELHLRVPAGQRILPLRASDAICLATLANVPFDVARQAVIDWPYPQH